MNNKYKIETLINEGQQVNNFCNSQSDVKFKNWRSKSQRYLSEIYNEDSLQYKQFDNISFHSGFYGGHDDGTNNENFHSGMVEALNLFSDYLKELKYNDSNTASSDDTISTNNISNNNVFVVHGRSTKIRDRVSHLLCQQGINPIILNEQPNKGKTIIEKIEANSNVGCAICIFTADDIGGLSDNGANEKRPRQNVIFETGYFMGKLGRENVIIVSDSEINFFSDINGCVYIDINNFEYELLRELKNLNYTVEIK